MFRSLIIFRAALRLGRFGAVVGLTLCLLCGGCHRLNLRGEKYQRDPLLELPRDLRRPDANTEHWGFSNKAQQIEANLGVGK